MNNKEIEYAIEYHEATKHSEVRLQMFRHYLDWDDKPRAFKVYPDLPAIPLPQDFPTPAHNALDCIGSLRPLHHRPPPDIHTLAQLLFFSAGITRKRKYDFGTLYMRAASATGALYPIELYVISREINGLAPGVYHFCPGAFSLTELRSGDYTQELAAMAGNNPQIMSSAVTLAFTSLAWRNAWKYGDRSYRHWFWDSGVIAANLLALAISAGMQPALVMGFVDSAVNNLLCLERRKEATVALAPLGSLHVSAANFNDTKPDPRRIIAVASPRIVPVSKREAEHQEIWKLHEASNLATNEEVTQWLDAKIDSTQQTISSVKSVKLQEGKWEGLQGTKVSGLGGVILLRGSSRRFFRSSISLAQLSTILYYSTRGVPLDFLKAEGSFADIYLIANAIEGLASGHYFYNCRANSLEQLERKSEIASRNESGYLCLGQALFSDASVVLFVMADMGAILKTLGNRGYRACEFEAGVVAGKIYLSSYAQGLGASGSTFYDDAVSELFSPHASDKAAMIAIGVGMPAYKARPGNVLAARLTKSELLSDN